MTAYPLFSQHVTGKVVDENDQPLASATIYFDGSTVGTLSKSDGTFKINYSAQSNLTLVVRYLGYETAYVSNPVPDDDYEIVLKPEENSLDEVVLDASPFSREEMLTAFRRDFLGETRAGRRTKILNEDSIRFYYDQDEQSLHATTREPIQLINKELGYKVEFDLVDFVSEFSKETLDKSHQKTNYFGGTSYFQNSTKVTKRIKRKRLKAYKGSSMHFFKALCNGNLKKENFELYHKSYQVPVSSVFKVNKTKVRVESTQADAESVYDDGYKVTVLGNDLEKPSEYNPLLKSKFKKQIAILHKGDRSDVTFKTNTFYVDKYGNHTLINEVLFAGEMSKGRMGGMLPINYEPND